MCIGGVTGRPCVQARLSVDKHVHRYTKVRAVFVAGLCVSLGCVLRVGPVLTQCYGQAMCLGDCCCGQVVWRWAALFVLEMGRD